MQALHHALNFVLHSALASVPAIFLLRVSALRVLQPWLGQWYATGIGGDVVVRSSMFQL